MLSLTVLVPTYCRTFDLERCLESIKRQQRSPDQVLVVVRDTDVETWSFLSRFDPGKLPLQIVSVVVPGQVAALNRGIESATGDIIAITDDDAAPRPEWLARIEQHFLADPQVGGVGGKDWCYQSGQMITETRAVVGQMQWYGRLIGNHNMGTDAAREVEFLKGANMSYRRTAIAGLQFETRLRGKGAQVHNDLAFSLSLKKAGWKLIYDPAVEVDHYHAQRLDHGQRSEFNYAATVDSLHNETLALLDYLSPIRRVIYLIWAVLIGVRHRRGILQCFRFLPVEGWLAVNKSLAGIVGRWRGWQTWKRNQSSANGSVSIQQQSTEQFSNSIDS
jgi:cellulose synthase/poly-beta-1,6-N-acetylglucosamine synthase-like glycosyltransferase